MKTTEERVQELCTRMLAAKDEEAVNEIAPLLKQALHEHCERMRKLVLLDFPPPPNQDMAAD